MNKYKYAENLYIKNPSLWLGFFKSPYNSPYTIAGKWCAQGRIVKNGIQVRRASNKNPRFRGVFKWCAQGCIVENGIQVRWVSNKNPRFRGGLNGAPKAVL
ncbi:hypothetical protein [Candidatus Avelusimicrobium alvi]|uniref:hypothetical protein n=1 Tax=Candidatus Avelusimicrobium alvi TaxID=3416221 RepID=UPI003D0C3CB8